MTITTHYGIGAVVRVMIDNSTEWKGVITKIVTTTEGLETLTTYAGTAQKQMSRNGGERWHETRSWIETEEKLRALQEPA